MFRKALLSLPLAVALFAAVLPAADLLVTIAPPRPLPEHRPVAPGRGYIWTPGYQRWNGNAYVWVPGTWVRPPRPRARWVPPHWGHRRGGWVFIPGYWR
jgi:hypothetical protein